MRDKFMLVVAAAVGFLLPPGAAAFAPLGQRSEPVVMALATADGTLVARFDYDPYGRLIRETGPKGATCPFRYLTKWYDADLGLLYYGHRWYDAAAMKWLSPDPIGERGGANLTAFCDGDPVNRVDPDGRHPVLVLAGLLWLALDRLAWAPGPDITPEYVEAVESAHQLGQARVVSFLLLAPVGGGAGWAARSGLSHIGGGALTRTAGGRALIWLGQTAAEGATTCGLVNLVEQGLDETPGVDVGEWIQTAGSGAAGWVVVKGAATLTVRGGRAWVERLSPVGGPQVIRGETFVWYPSSGRQPSITGLTPQEVALRIQRGYLPAEYAVCGFAMENAGRLLPAGTELPNAGGVIRSFVQKGDRVYYRVFSGDRTVGSYLTAVPPRSRAWAQEALSLPPWNTAEYIQEVLVPDGTLLQRSRALAVPEWGRYRGGAEQFWILPKQRLPPHNYGPGVPLP